MMMMTLTFGEGIIIIIIPASPNQTVMMTMTAGPGSVVIIIGRHRAARARSAGLCQRRALLVSEPGRHGFVDAAVIACAERNGGRVLTLNPRDFGIVAGEGTISSLPD